MKLINKTLLFSVFSATLLSSCGSGAPILTIPAPTRAAARAARRAAPVDFIPPDKIKAYPRRYLCKQGSNLGIKSL